MTRRLQAQQQGWRPLSHPPFANGGPSGVSGAFPADTPLSPLQASNLRDPMRPVYVPARLQQASEDRPVPPRLIQNPDRIQPLPFNDLQPRNRGRMPPGVQERTIQTNQATTRNFPLRALLAIMPEMSFARAVAACRVGGALEVPSVDEEEARGEDQEVPQPVWDCAGPVSATERQGQDAEDVNGAQASMDGPVISSSGSQDARECEICQAAYERDDLVLMLPCQHFFHR